MKIELTLEELNSLANMLDIAVKSGGIRVAAQALAIFQKLEAAAAEEGTKVKEDN